MRQSRSGRIVLVLIALIMIGSVVVTFGHPLPDFCGGDPSCDPEGKNSASIEWLLPGAVVSALLYGGWVSWWLRQQ